MTGSSRRSRATKGIDRRPTLSVGGHLDRGAGGRIRAPIRGILPGCDRDSGRPEAAHDVVQEAFARALIERNRFRGGRPEAWVWRIVEREALRRRRAGRHLPLEDTFAPELIQDEHDPALVAAVRGLAPRRRLVVFLQYFADLSYAEIARLCGIAEGTVAATLFQAHADLRRALELEGVER